MSVSHITTATLSGIGAYEVMVEVDIIPSLPGVNIVGLPDAAITESKERIRSALKNSGYTLPPKKIVINLAPADTKKEGTGFDLPMAVGILACEGIVDIEKTRKTAFVGELSLDGNLRAVNGVLSIVCALKELGVENVIVPFDNAQEAALIQGITVYPAEALSDVVNMFAFEPQTQQKLQPYSIDIRKYFNDALEEQTVFDFKDVKGQQKAKRALEIAAAGGHNILMSGSPGSGKTLLAKCFSGILPPLEMDEAIELTKIYSISGLIDRDNPLIVRRPFRSPHHSASPAGIIGGGSSPKPGEITLSHRGVLFLDEMVEFPRTVLEVLRQPLEDGVVTISRVQTSIKYPADFILLAAMNPCPCGYAGDSQKQCTCSAMQAQRYWNRLSGPLLDRIDLQIEVPRLNEKELMNKDNSSEASSEIRNRVIKAREVQLKRFKVDKINTNSQMTPKLIKKYCALSSECENILRSAITKFNLSGRSYDRVLKLSRTIADLSSSEQIQVQHIAEALQYRNIDRAKN